MKRKKRQQKSSHKKNHKTKVFSSSLSSKKIVKKRWKARKITFSPYPYLMNISYYRTNVFFTVADIQGRTKIWTATGRSGFKNKDKTTYMAIVRAMEIFLKKVSKAGIRRLILQFRNLYRRHARFAIRFSLRKFKRKFRFQYLGLLVRNQIAFNGCRKKKKRRK